MKSRRSEYIAYVALFFAIGAFLLQLQPRWEANAGSARQDDSDDGQVEDTVLAPSADWPITFSYQGELRQANGSPANGPYTMTLTIYDAVVSGTSLYTETVRNVLVRDGLFTVLLGDQAGGPSISPAIFKTMPRYLGIAVLPDPEMLPRQRIHPVPWATNADLLDGQDASKLVPPGTVVAFAGPNPPAGWLLCNGAAISREQYPTLFAAIGTANGSGNGSTTFNLPDYRGRFLRGVDGGVGRDPDRVARTAANPGGNTGDAVGSIQGGATKGPVNPFTTNSAGNHSHSLTLDGQWGNNWDDTLGWSQADGEQWGNVTFNTNATGDHAHTITGGGDNETRPINAYVVWIIKY